MRSYRRPTWTTSFHEGIDLAWLSCKAEMEASIVPDIDARPIRLIDVDATINGSSQGSICFAAANHGWDFHVISHTWSQDVRNLSEEIGKCVLVQSASKVRGADVAVDAYNEAFKKSDFSKERCYKLLIEFLRLLVPEGVKKIWFDALCINQVELEEKAREIGNMGAYYGRSNGCYVILHGLGEGYQLWAHNESLPRWFTRVWTFQEFMLPRRLIFIVEGLDRRMIAFINKEIISKSKNGFCRCFAERMTQGEVALWGSASNSVWWHFIAPGMGKKTWEMEQADAGAEILFSSKSYEPCVKCGSLPMIRKAHMNETISTAPGSAAQLYMVDREAYLGVMQFLPSLSFQLEREEDFVLSSLMFVPKRHGRRSGLSTLMSLYRMFVQERLLPIWNVRYTIAEIRMRRCSVEEDRVLSILAMLGVKLSQLRTGEGLQKQLVELAKVCEEEMLVELIMVDAKPNATMGMSWAPDLTPANSDEPQKNPWHDSNVMRTRCEVDVDIKKLQVSEMGSITLSAKVVPGVVLPVGALPVALTNKDTRFYDEFLCGKLRSPSHFLVVPPSQRKMKALDQFLACTSTPSLINLSTDWTVSSIASVAEWCSVLPLDLHTIEETSAAAMSSSEEAKQLILNFEINWRAQEAGHVGQFQVPVTVNASSLQKWPCPFAVQMVVLGAGERTGSEELLSQVMVVCLSSNSTKDDGREVEELHKIGMLSLAEEETQATRWDMDTETFQKASKRECLISGFGPDLSSHIELRSFEQAGCML